MPPTVVRLTCAKRRLTKTQLPSRKKCDTHERSDSIEALKADTGGEVVWTPRQADNRKRVEPFTKAITV